MSDEAVLNLGADANVEKAFVNRATDPVVTNVGTPADFAAQFPTPLETSELLAMCEEVSLLRTIPEEMTGLKTVTWREMSSLAFTSGSTYIAFTDGACPEEYTHDGANKTLDLKNLGAKKSLTLSDIMHSVASISAGYGINNLVAGFAGSAGLPGGGNSATVFTQARIADLKAKEMQLASVLLLNGWDELLVNGDDSSNPLEFDGIETQVVSGNGAHVNSATSASGTFSAAEFDRFLAEACAKATHVFGHPSAIQEMLSGYFQLGFQGSQVIAQTAQGMVPGFNFAGEVNTGIGRLICVADINFTRTNDGSGKFTSALFPLRMSHNGEQLVKRITQIPLSFKDLAPGCTAISFQLWVKTALQIKLMCAQSRFNSHFTGNIVSTCTKVG